MADEHDSPETELSSSSPSSSLGSVPVPPPIGLPSGPVQSGPVHAEPVGFEDPFELVPPVTIVVLVEVEHDLTPEQTV